MEPTMNEEDFNSPGAAALRIKKVVDEMPRNVAAAIFDDLPSSTMVGAAIRQQDGQVLLNYLRSMNMEDMGDVGERLTHASQVFESSQSLQHIPHCESLLKIIDATAAQVDGIGESIDEDAQAFYELLRQISPAIPGIDSDNEPMVKMYYEETEDIELDEFKVLAKARDTLSGEIIESPRLMKERECNQGKLLAALTRDLLKQGIPLNKLIRTWSSKNG